MWKEMHEEYQSVLSLAQGSGVCELTYCKWKQNTEHNVEQKSIKL